MLNFTEIFKLKEMFEKAKIPFVFRELKDFGGFAEFERIAFWDMKDELIGRIISVQYFEVTQNTTTGEYSLRFPEFLELKPIGQEINN